MNRPGDIPERQLAPRAIRQSDELHERVRRFAELSYESPAIREARRESFETLALDIARHQREFVPGLSRLSDNEPRALDEIPAVHAEAFKLARVAAHPPELDTAVFRTSGTTQAESGLHPVRSLETYRQLALRLGKNTLFAGHDERGLIVSLGMFPGSPPSSSLGYMMRLFMETWDGRKVTLEPEGSTFDPAERSRWLGSGVEIDVEGLIRAAKIARARNETLFVLSTSFALAALLEALDGESIPTPPRTKIMLTGGFKGKIAEVSSSELRSRLCKAFRTTPENILGEYGMTELTSQLYEAIGPNGPRPNVYVPPDWLRVVAVDPETWLPVSRRSAGIARFIDLGNIDSSLVVQTDDRIIETEHGFELLGRLAGATPRGCSLPFEGLLTTRGRS